MQASAEPEASAPEWALLVEVPAPECSLHNCKLEELTSRPLCLQNDGVLVDVHADCHRVAFNQAFSREHACRGICLLFWLAQAGPQSLHASAQARWQRSITT